MTGETMLNGLVTAALVVLLLLAKEWGMAWWKRRQQPAAPAIVLAVHRACADVGLNVDELQPETDLAATGKLKDVLHMAAATLGKDAELQTVQDVIDWLAEAPAK